MNKLTAESIYSELEAISNKITHLPDTESNKLNCVLYYTLDNKPILRELVNLTSSNQLAHIFLRINKHYVDFLKSKANIEVEDDPRS